MLLSDRLHSSAKRQSDKAFAAGYDKGKSDAVKQKYWLYVSMQRQGNQVSSVRLYPVRLTEQRIDGVTFQSLPFIYDVADLYKHLTSVPAAFLAVRQNPADDGDLVRKLLKQRVEEERLLQRMPRDLEMLFAETQANSDKSEIADRKSQMP